MGYLILIVVTVNLILEWIKNRGKLTGNSCAKFYGTLIIGTMGSAWFDNRPLEFIITTVLVLGLLFGVSLVLLNHKDIARLYHSI